MSSRFAVMILTSLLFTSSFAFAKQIFPEKPASKTESEFEKELSKGFRGARAPVDSGKKVFICDVQGITYQMSGDEDFKRCHDKGGSVRQGSADQRSAPQLPPDSEGLRPPKKDEGSR